MKSITIQFHATVEELIEFVNLTATKIGLSVTLITRKPFSLKNMQREIILNDLIPKLDRFNVQIALTIGEANLTASSASKFLDLNPGCVEIEVGFLSDLGLYESGFLFTSDDIDKIVIANKITAQLKNATKAGVIAVNPASGATAKMRSFRYTKGAKALFDQGVKILPIAGNSILQLPD